MSESNPLISICIPTYNGSKFLLDALKCAIDQTYRNLEILIVDDCSMDDTVQKARNFAIQDPRVRVLVNDQNLGLVGNWNRCLDVANGDYIKFHFQDDLMHRNCVDKMVEAAFEGGVALVLAKRKYIFETNAESRRTFYESRLTKLSDYFRASTVLATKDIATIFTEDFLGMNFLGEPIAGLFHRDVIQKYGNFDKRMRQICDFEYWMRVALNEPIYYLDKELVYFRVHGASATQANRDQTNEISISFQDRLIFWELLEESRHYELFRRYCLKAGISIYDLFRRRFTELANAEGLRKSLQSIPFATIRRYYNFSPTNIAKIAYFLWKR